MSYDGVEMAVMSDMVEWWLLKMVAGVVVVVSRDDR